MTDIQATCPVAGFTNSTTARPRFAPGPSRAQSIGLYARTRDPLRFLAVCRERYGNTFRLPLGAGGIIVFNEHEDVVAWLRDEQYQKSDFVRAAIPIAGEGLAMSVGDRWRRMRRAMNPVFGRSGIEAVAELIGEALQTTVDRWESLADTGREVDMAEEFGRLTLTTFQRTMLPSLSEGQVEEMVPLLRDQFRYISAATMMYWAPSWVPRPGQRRGEPASARLREMIDGVIAQRRANPTDTPDLLNRLMEIRYEDTGEPLSDLELRGELNAFLIGGYDTTAQALTWAFALLGQSPEVAERLRIEADGYDGDFSSLADLDALPYAEAVFHEAIRIGGLGLLGYIATEDGEINGWHVPAGSHVAYSGYLLGQDARTWENPQRFEPERFLGERLEAQGRHQFLAFGAGRHRCIGARFSTLQATFALTIIARRFHIQPRPGFVLRPQYPPFPCGVRGGLPATLRSRAGVRALA